MPRRQDGELELGAAYAAAAVAAAHADALADARADGPDREILRGRRLVELPLDELEPGRPGPGKHRAPRRGPIPWIAAVVVLACLIPLVHRVAAPAEGRPEAATATGITAGTVQIAGAGFGHGVGMSQYGARGQAQAGASAAAILGHYYPGTTVAGYPDKVDVRVNVVHQAAAVQLRGVPLAAGSGGIQIVPSGAAPVTAAADDVVTVLPGSGRLVFTVRRAGGGTSQVSAPSAVVRWSGGRGMGGPAGLLSVASTSTTGGSPTAGKVRRYRWGSLALTAVRSRIEGVAVVDLHSEYLRGIAEMPSSWPVEALKTQVIAARNYALREVHGGTSAQCGGCHLWDDTRSQVYAGWSKESEGSFGARWVTAVNATQLSATTGMAVLYQGQPITAYYSSSTGGRSRNSARVWGGSVPYLVSVPDPWSVDPANNRTFAAWRRTVSVSRVLAAFGLPDLVSLRVASRDDSGAALTVTARSSRGDTRTLSGSTVRRRFALPAEWITGISLPGATPAPPTGGGSGGTSSTAVSAVPARLVPAGTSAVYHRSGTRVVAGRTWRTSCRTSPAYGYRCETSARGTVYRKGADGRWGPVIDWVPQRTTYFDTVRSAWTGQLRATPGRRTVAGQTYSTRCTRASGARVCTTSQWAEQIGRRPAGSGYFYYRYRAWRVASQVVLVTRST